MDRCVLAWVELMKERAGWQSQIGTDVDVEVDKLYLGIP